ncbi:uncharacterized protein [Oscarella lobularis]|uniref:uncharacterized protein n=1 Tax=Oscarella lobularis TaxID=121494 RepID=UPI0033130D48
MISSGRHWADVGGIARFELHFCFPFSLPSDSPTWDGRTVQVDHVSERKALLRKMFGYDDTSLFKENVKTTQVKAFSIEGNEINDRLTLLLPLRNESGTWLEFILDDVFLREFAGKSAGIVRFTVTPSDNGVHLVQHLLDMQNAIRMLCESKRTQKLTVKMDDIDKESWPIFNPKDFVLDILQKKYNKQSQFFDEHTEDRLYSFTIAQVSGLREESQLKRAAYYICQMEWDAKSETPDEYVDDFIKERLYKRHARSDGGVYPCFHKDGGCILFFHGKENASELKVWKNHRKDENEEIGTVLGTARPLAAFSLIEILLLRRMVLRRFGQRVEGLIISEKRNEDNLKKLQKLQGEMLSFKADLSKPVTTSSVVAPQLKMWSTVVGIDEMMKDISESVNDLYGFYSGIVEKKSQKRLDLLATMLSFLGIADLVSSVYLAYSTSTIVPSSDRDNLNVTIPFVLIGILLMVAVIFVIRFQMLK